MNALSIILVIAQRDFLKFLRDRARLVGGFIFPFVFIVLLGGSLNASLGEVIGYNFLTFTFVGVLAQTIWQSGAMGLISLIEDRENDFSQEIFVSPVSRYLIILGKIVGETLVALPQGLGIMVFGFVIGVPFTPINLLGLLIASVAIALFGGAFGVLVLANLSSQRSANQIFPFVMLPQFFLAGVFNPIVGLPWYLDILSKLSPLRYAVDLARGILYAGRPEYDKVVLASPLTNLIVIAVAFVVFLVVGTTLFVRSERNR